MKKFIFDLITSPYSLFDNPFYNYITMLVVGSIAFVIAWNLVEEIGVRGQLGSILHWIIRFIAFIIIWLILSILINIVQFIKRHWFLILICIILLTTLIILNIYAKKHPSSFLNKKIL